MADYTRVVLGLDLDAVCADYAAGYLKFFVEELNRQDSDFRLGRQTLREKIITNLSAQQPPFNFLQNGSYLEILRASAELTESDIPQKTQWGFAEWGLGPEEHTLLNAHAVCTHHLFADLPVIAGVIDALPRLKMKFADQGYNLEIKIITSRLQGAGKPGVPSSFPKQVITQTAQWVDGVIPFDSFRVGGPKQEEFADVYLDDSPFNIKSLQTSGKTTITFDQLYNRGVTGRRAHNWIEVESILLEMMIDGCFEKTRPSPVFHKPFTAKHGMGTPGLGVTVTPAASKF